MQTEFERRLIGQRTRDALAQKRLAGVRLGRPASISASVTSQIRELRTAGLTLRGIVERLDHEGVPTVSGGGWPLWEFTSPAWRRWQSWCIRACPVPDLTG